MEGLDLTRANIYALLGPRGQDFRSPFLPSTTLDPFLGLKGCGPRVSFLPPSPPLLTLITPRPKRFKTTNGHDVHGRP